MKIRLFLISITLTLIGACSSDSPSNAERFQNFAKDKSGLYQVALEQDGKAKLIQLSIHSLSAILILTDDRDDTQLVASTYDDSSKTLKFSNTADCNAAGTAFECMFDGQKLVLEKQEVIDSNPAIAELAGNYTVASNDQLGTITLSSDGKFTANFSSCEISGGLSLESSVMGINETSNSCVGNPSSGIVRLDTLYAENDTLEALLPNSPLAGFWLK